MFIEQNYFFWWLAHDLITTHDFEVLHINTKDQELWLEKDYKWKTHIVRLQHTQLNWRNQLQKDVHITYQQVKQNKQMFRGRNISIHMVYVSEYPPVDEWDDLKNGFADRKHSLNVFYLYDEKKREEQNRFYNFFDLDEPKVDQHVRPDEMEATIPYLKQQIATIHQKRKKEAKSLFRHGKTRMIYLLLLLNIIMFMFIEWKGDSTSITTLIKFGAKYNPAILDGEWWRIISSMFIHIGFLHLTMNMLALYYLGTAVEKIYGTSRFTVIYLLAGIFGGVASFMLNPHVAAGASGAIFGLFGALLYFGICHKRLFFRTMGWNLIFVIGINIAFGLIVPQVDNGAHLGGLVGGLLASAAINLPKRRNLRIQSLAVLGYVFLLVIMIIAGGFNLFNNKQVDMMQEQNRQGSYEEFEAEPHFHRGFTYSQTVSRSD